MSQDSQPVSIVHGHYYQPPRENPWLEEVEQELSAEPFHDWNERIEQECYRAVTAARLPGRDGRIAKVVNTLAWSSFNFGPTLLNWLETEAPATYAAILEADRESLRRTGHGNAIAHPYHHVILPLSSRRDKVTEVRWGIRDFRRRFGREPEGMWLPETAVDDETLDVLAEHGIRFTVLAPHQASPRPAGGRPGLYRTGSGREIALFLYDGDLSHGVAFGELVRDAELWLRRIGERHGIALVATDGETYGHHHKFGEMALARVVTALGDPSSLSAVLARYPAQDPVRLNAPSSWSCAHGVERWRSECGCRIAPHIPSQQRWRAVLRSALNWLAEEIHAIYLRESSGLFADPWEARNRYDPNLDDPALPPRARELLELERHALLLFTSCAWFFDDIAGLEPVQVLRYAARAIELAGPDGARLESALLARLAQAHSNDAAAGSGRDIYLSRVKPAIPHEVRMAGGLALLSSQGIEPGGAVARAWQALVGATDGGWEVELQHRRTRRTHRYRVTLAGDIMTVTAADSGPGSPAWRLEESALWDRHRALLAQARRRRLATALFDPELRRQLADGTVDLSTAARAALVTAIARVPGDGPDGAAQALELVTQLGLTIPFEAQTRMAAVLDAASASDLPDLHPLAWRLGFDVPPPRGS